jgi:glycosyltransferase involved in cell wall biosynthesis
VSGYLESVRPTASILVPAFREEAGIASSLRRIAAAVGELDRYDWEIVVVDDGSPDDTAGEVTRAAKEIDVPVRLVRHATNQGLGGALRTGFAATTGVVVVVLDSDLSYHESHIAALVREWERTRAHVVVASAYMPGGRSTGVPPMLERRSRTANRILSSAALDDLKTLTGMVRAYDGPFVRGLSLKAVDVDINVEILYKTQLLRGTIVEIPAHLDWSGLADRAARGAVMSRRSRWNTAKSLVLTYLFRPFWFPLAPALLLGLLALVLAAIGKLGWQGLAVASLVLSVTLAVTSLGMLQAKRYFEELYFQGTRTQANRARGSAGVADPREPTPFDHPSEATDLT